MRPLKLFVIIAWVITITLLLKKEGFFSRGQTITYYDILGKKDPYREEYLGIYLKKEKIGFSKSYIDASSINDEVGFKISNETRIFIKAFDEPFSIHIATEILIDDKYRLSSFSFTISQDQYKIRAKGERVNNKIITSIYSGETLISKREYKERDFVFTNEFLPLSGLPSISEGKVYFLEGFDPFGIIGREKIKMEVLKKTTLLHNDELFAVYPIILTYQDVKAKVYVTKEGKILRAYLPQGFMAKAEDEKKGKKFSYPDISSLSSIPSNILIKEPRRVSFLKIKKNGEILTIKRDVLKDVPLFLPIKEYGEWTKETPFVQSNDKDIQKTAMEITKGEKDSLKASILLMKWVYATIYKNPSFSIPSAIEVLKNKRGDCNEHTVLFTALARSLGIPTKMIVGLCYQDGRFYYHNWAMVFCGKWIPIDPTFNQVPVDATHIPLIEGDIEKQIGLLGYIGDIKIEVIEYGYN